jgi:hypothetical protein
MTGDLGARVQEALGLAEANARDLSRAAAFADEAVLLAEEHDEPLLLAKALVARLTARSGPDDLDSRLATSLRLLGLVRHVPDAEVRLQAHLWRLTTGLEQLDLATIRRQLAALDLLADETSDARIRFFAYSRGGMLARSVGDVVGAARLAAVATEAGVAARLPDTEAVQRTLHAEMARQRDDRTALTRAATTLEQRGAVGDVPTLLAEAAVLWLEGGEADRAGRIVDRLSPGLTDLPRNPDWLLVVGKLCEAAAGSGRTDTAALCAEQLRPYAGRAVLKSGAVAFGGVVDDYLALATGDVEQAERARAAYARIGADWWARRGPLGRPTGQTETATGPRVLHLHPADGAGPTRLWCVGREGAIRMVPSMHGLEYVRVLLERPGVDVPVLELMAAADGTPVIADDGVLVDQQALTAYRRRVRELDEDIERADARGDHELSGRLAEERAALIAQTRSGGLQGAQRSATQSERTRVGVRQAITAALARLALHDSEVAHELRSTIRTGVTCRYQPDPFRPVDWRVHNGHPASQPSADL